MESTTENGSHMTEKQQCLYERLSDSQRSEYEEYRQLGLGVDAAINIASQKATGFLRPTSALSTQ